jgi:hypothetical protein
LIRRLRPPPRPNTGPIDARPSRLRKLGSVGDRIAYNPAFNG